MSLFTRPLRLSPAYYFDERPERPSADISWEVARRLTDNRLRAMRSWIEGGGEKRDGHVGYLKANLLNTLRQLASETRRNRYDDYDEDHSEGRINGLIEIIKDIKIADGPKFASVYELIGVPVPETVMGTSWDYRRRPRIGEVGAYDMEVARDIVRRDPWM